MIDGEIADSDRAGHARILMEAGQETRSILAFTPGEGEADL